MSTLGIGILLLVIGLLLTFSNLFPFALGAVHLVRGRATMGGSVPGAATSRRS